MSVLAALLALLAPALLAEIQDVSLPRKMRLPDQRYAKAIGVPELPRGCLYEGRWFAAGAAVATREACLICACGRGALHCRRRACAALPDPPPRRCHVLHRKGACCPELHCPDGVKLMEHSASARFENEDTDIATPASVMHACVEGGTVYAAGSAMGSGVACEQCFCLGGARRCVRPRCLPPPRRCRARPAPGACCPQRYYCDPPTADSGPEHAHIHDCLVKGERIAEGERVLAAESKSNCTQCFCLRGSVRCQPMACSPPLLGCQPLLRPGECCPHQYHCDHKSNGLVTSHNMDNGLLLNNNYVRSFHTHAVVEHETTTKIVEADSTTLKTTASVVDVKVPSSVTTKVKRKISDSPPLTTKEPEGNATTRSLLTTTPTDTPTTKKEASTTVQSLITDASTDTTSTEQPEGSVKIMINGTINCTAELSSTSIPLNVSSHDKDRIQMESHLRTPVNKIDIEAYTEYPNDIITDRNANGDFEDDDTFTINVTSSLRTNSSLSTIKPSIPTTAKLDIMGDLVHVLNTSKKTKGDYDYDYTEPTLPPSLPNLKIIPFVAADAVVDDDIASKGEPLAYPILEREDKFPVYYPTADTKDIPYATRREDVLPPTQYPVFVSDKGVEPKYPALIHNVKQPMATAAQNDLDPQLDYTVSTSIENNIPQEIKTVTKPPTTSSAPFSLETPSINLFSPPVETEGGFIPKGPGIIEEYYAVYPSTPPGPPTPHLTTSMQLDITKGECVSSDGRHVLEGDSISLACSICTCAWGELHCSPRPCHIPPGCSRRPATSSSVDLCCGEIVCTQDEIKTIKPNLLIDIKANESKKVWHNESSLLKEEKLAHNNITATSTQLPETVKETANNTANITTEKEVMNTTLKDDLINASTTPSTETITTSSSIPTTTKLTAIYDYTIDSKNQSLEYEDEEEEDEGFSLGSVLEMLLSDNYGSTTIPPKKKSTVSTTTIPAMTKVTTMAPPPTINHNYPLKPPISPFIPMPHHPHLYMPPKKSYMQNTVNRIDHLVLGEATAIKRTTMRPVTTPRKPVVTYKPTTKYTTTQRPYVTTRLTEVTRNEEELNEESAMKPMPKPMSSSTLPLPGILKLAGCNIYGRMYRVGRIITELSTPCQECWCTELGVQCNSLKC